MPILLAIAGLAFLALLFGPQLWVRRAIARHGADRPDLPGTAAELARHLLDEANLPSVMVEPTDKGDHYDPEAQAVRLLPQHHDGRSVAAVAVAAHEVSHAVQHARGEAAFALRWRLARHFGWIDRVAGATLVLAPLVFVFVKIPLLFALQMAAGILLFVSQIVLHMVTLPVESDASFGKGPPALVRGRYLAPADMPAARSVL